MIHTATAHCQPSSACGRKIFVPAHSSGGGRGPSALCSQRSASQRCRSTHTGPRVSWSCAAWWQRPTAYVFVPWSTVASLISIARRRCLSFLLTRQRSAQQRIRSRASVPRSRHQIAVVRWAGHLCARQQTAAQRMLVLCQLAAIGVLVLSLPLPVSALRCCHSTAEDSCQASAGWRLIGGLLIYLCPELCAMLSQSLHSCGQFLRVRQRRGSQQFPGVAHCHFALFGERKLYCHAAILPPLA